MSSAALFGSAVSGPGSTHGAKHLVEVKAGRMNLKGKMVYPDKRKGLLYVYQSDDSLMHFCWKDRTTGVVEDDLIIFPDDCEYVRVQQCTTGRAYLLKFKSSNRRFFFWLQEPRTDKDEENCKKINEYLNNPPGPGGLSAGGSTGTGGSVGLAGADQDLQSLLNNMSQSQLMQLFGGVGQIGGLSSLLGTISRPSTGSSRTVSSPTVPRITTTVPSTPATGTNSSSTTTPVATPQNTQQPQSALNITNAPRANRTAPKSTEQSGATSGTATTPIQLADLQNLLQGITPATEQQVDLSSALTTEALSSILNDSEALNQLQEHLPAVGGTSQEQLRSTLQSPQFQQAVSMFSSALQSGQLAPVVSQLAVNPEAVSAASQGDMQGFVKALEKDASESSKTGKESEKKNEKKDAKGKDDDDDDEGMQLG